MACSASTGHAQDQRFPAKPIQVISTATPGSQGDTLLRFLATQAGKTLGQPVVVVTKVSAAGMVGTDRLGRGGYRWQRGAGHAEAYLGQRNPRVWRECLSRGMGSNWRKVTEAGAG
jgi:tripartite-type tricarboxylate transporter receptor subunit TctC